LCYRFADLSLNPGQRRVTRGNEPIRLGKLTYQMLQVLVESAPNVVSQDDFARKVWKRRIVSGETVAQRVKLLRDALSDRAVNPRYVRLVRGHGYRLLQDVQTIAAACTRDQRLAVLPFESFSSELRDAYFADGLHEEILTHLAGSQSFEVIARTTVRQYEGTQRSIPEIAAELEVGSVMEGSVRYSDGRIRVTAQLIDGASGAHVWAEIYDGDFDDIFATQTQIASRITSRLGSEVFSPARNSHDLSANGHNRAKQCLSVARLTDRDQGIRNHRSRHRDSRLT
jgi:TolB-like protein